MGRKSFLADVTLIRNGSPETKKVEFFAWEKLDYVDAIRKEFGI
jgi:S-adenosylmethionine synthetase